MICGATLAQGMVDEQIAETLTLELDPSDWLIFSRTYDNQRFSPP